MFPKYINTILYAGWNIQVFHYDDKYMWSIMITELKSIL